MTGSSSIPILFNVVDTRWNKSHEAACRSIIQRFYDYFNNDIPVDIKEFSFLLGGMEDIREVNRITRKTNYACDVLSFYYDGVVDIAISYDGCQGFARKAQIKFESRLLHLVLHSVLHCVGYDHDIQDNYKEMRSIEQDILGARSVIYS